MQIFAETAGRAAESANKEGVGRGCMGWNRADRKGRP